MGSVLYHFQGNFLPQAGNSSSFLLLASLLSQIIQLARRRRGSYMFNTFQGDALAALVLGGQGMTSTNFILIGLTIFSELLGNFSSKAIEFKSETFCFFAQTKA
jgi:hypothetical protein